MTESTAQYDVLVVGAGIAGLALTRALHRKGISALTLERRAGPQDAGFAINLLGNAIDALDALGLGEGVRRHGHPVRRRDYRTARGRTLFAIDEVAFWGERSQPRCMRRADLLALLGDGLPNVRRNCAVTAVRERRDGVEVALSDGSVAAARLLVGADGVRSTVRLAAMGEATQEAARLAAASWRFMAPNPGVDGWTLWAGREGLFLLIPVGGNEVYGWAAATGDRRTASDPAVMAALFAGFPAIVRATVDRVLADPGSVHHSPLEEVRIPSWGRGHILLIGDAAHATAPVWAQGAALAMEDALVLAECLAERADWSDVARDYEARRRPRVDHVQAMTDRMSRAARLPTLVRNVLLPFVGPKTYAATYAPLRRPATLPPAP